MHCLVETKQVMTLPLSLWLTCDCLLLWTYSVWTVTQFRNYIRSIIGALKTGRGKEKPSTVNWQGKIPTQTTSRQNPVRKPSLRPSQAPRSSPSDTSAMAPPHCRLFNGSGLRHSCGLGNWNCQVNIRACFSEDIPSSPRFPWGLQIDHSVHRGSSKRFWSAIHIQDCDRRQESWEFSG